MVELHLRVKQTLELIKYNEKYEAELDTQVSEAYYLVRPYLK